MTVLHYQNYKETYEQISTYQFFRILSVVPCNIKMACTWALEPQLLMTYVNHIETIATIGIVS
jgi:hypothetical protein